MILLCACGPQVHLRLLQQLLPSATGVAKGKVSSTLETLKDVAQTLKQHQAGTGKPM